MSLVLAPGTAWQTAYGQARSAAPEAFSEDGALRNLYAGQWNATGAPASAQSPVDGSPISGAPRLERDRAAEALAGAVEEHKTWGDVPLAERKRRTAEAVAAMRENRDTLALLLVWEIGKPWRLACADVDRALDGVDWYIEQIDRQLGIGTDHERGPLPGPVSNIASWNYPMSVLMHALLVQMLAGNAVMAKTPTDGGAACLTLACALARQAGLPVTLVSGYGSRLSSVLVSNPDIGALAFVGGRSAGGQVAAGLVDTGKRHMLEQEGLNAWGVWEFSDWDLLAGHLKKGFEYAKQRCTAYPRYVVQRRLFPEFMRAYLPVLDSLKFGHPLAVENEGDPLPELDFGPVINPAKAAELRAKTDELIAKGGIPLHLGDLASGRFLPGQDTSAYVAPAAILSPPPSAALHHAEPFGPIDTVVIVDTESELLAAMNASNGALVASIACDDEKTATRLGGELHAYKVGINKPRSRGDKAETFGGRGASWKGAFVGGDLLVQAVTTGPDTDERLYGNFPSYSLYPS
jgi:acyl-CoA reductase-like NAD-dependent aldehyde dehydrogenase